MSDTKPSTAHATARHHARTLGLSAGSLFAIRLAIYAAPLITTPWLARVLGPGPLGILAVAQGIGACLILVVEYGFSFSATQQVAESCDSPRRLALILAGVNGAKAVLAIGCCALLAAAYPILPHSIQDPVLLTAVAISSVGQAFGMSWYFLGLRQMPLIALFEAISRVAAAAAILWLVRDRNDLWLVPALQAAGSWATFAASLTVAYHRIPVPGLRLGAVLRSLRKGRGALFFRVAETSYTSCNSLILGFFCPVETVGLFAGAEKIVRALIAVVLDPIQRATYPQIVSALVKDRSAARRLHRLTTAATLGLAIAISAGVAMAAPVLIRLILGPGFDGAVLPFRILLLILVPISLKWSFGLNWMIPLNQLSLFNRVIAFSTLLYLILVLVAVPRLQGPGMAMVIMLTESAIALILVALVVFRRNASQSSPKETVA